ncbi:MAG TPA: hypothetical protein VF263_09065 [Longimicrobiaceae bacterium]
MSRSFIHLRRALLGASCAVVFGFGATTAAAEPEVRAPEAKCPPGTSLCPNGYCAGPHESCPRILIPG